MSGDALFDVQAEVVVITGVSGQLGCEYARAFLQRGAKVVGLDLQTSDGSQALCSQFSDGFLFLEADVTQKRSLQNIESTIEQRFGSPTVLINNAALDSPPSASDDENGPFEDYPEASWDKVMDVNLKGVYHCCQVFGGAMAKRSRGAIINVASIYGLVSPGPKFI